jgi:diguanylate cyclase (GGDEF)-like protein/PAS domain S-box-containing protein
MLFIFAALILLILGSRAIKMSASDANAAVEEERKTYLLEDAINETSDNLTEQLRTFTVTLDRRNLDAYWNKLAESRSRDRALAKTLSPKMSPGEKALLSRAKQEFDGLLAVEGRAMRLAAEAIRLDVGSLPPEFAATSLGPRDMILPAQAKLELARELAYGKAYWERKAVIRSILSDFSSLAHKRVEARTRAAQAATDRAFAFTTTLCFVVFFFGAFIIILYYRLTALPVIHYIKTIGTEDKREGYPALKPEGCSELVALAEAINERRAQRMRTELALRESEQRLKTNLRMMPLAAMEVDRSDRILTWNPAAQLMFGYSESEALGRNVIDLVVPEGIKDEIHGVISRLNRGDVIDMHINKNITKDGREITCEWFNTPLYDTSGANVGWASLVKDITVQQAEAERILYLARHDPLTGLLNRRSMRGKLDEERQRCMRTGERYSTIMLDIDRFKLFNDRYGHECGDAVLKDVAAAMTETLRRTDSVGRWGGEEFLVLLPATEGAGSLGLAEKIRRRIEDNATAYDGKELKVTVTAGLSTCLDGEETVDDCLRRADEALLAGKAQGRNRVVAS